MARFSRWRVWFLCVLLCISFLIAPSAQAARMVTVSGAPHVVDLRDFGAAGAGDATADAKVFAAALDALTGRGRTTVLFIPAGRYVLPALDLPDNLQIIGDGAILAGANGRLLLRGPHHGLAFVGVSFEGLTLDAAAFDNTSFTRCHFAATDAAPAFATQPGTIWTRGSILGATFAGTAQPAIALAGQVQAVTVLGATVTGHGDGADVDVGASGAGLVFASVDFQHIGRSAVHVVSGAGVVFRAITAESAGDTGTQPPAPIFQVDAGGKDSVFQAVHSLTDPGAVGKPGTDFRLDGDGTTLDGVVSDGNPQTGRSFEGRDPDLFVNVVRVANAPTQFRSLRGLDNGGRVGGYVITPNGAGDGPVADNTHPIDLTTAHPLLNPTTDIPAVSDSAARPTCAVRVCAAPALRMTPPDWAHLPVVDVAAYGPALVDPESESFDPTAPPPDMTAALQHAIDAAGDGGSHIVYLPPGIYGLSAPLVLKSGVMLQGAGRNRTIIAARTATLPSLFSLTTARGGAHIALADLSLSGGTNALTAAPDVAVNDLFIARISIADQSDTALALPSLANSLIVDSTITAARYGLRSVGAVFGGDHPGDAGILHNLAVVHSMISDMTGDGINGSGPFVRDSALYGVTGARLGGALTNVAGDGWYAEGCDLRGDGTRSAQALVLGGSYNVVQWLRASNGSDSHAAAASVVFGGGVLRLARLANGSRVVPSLLLTSSFGAAALDHLVLTYNLNAATLFFRAGGVAYLTDVALGNDANVVATNGNTVRQIASGVLTHGANALLVRSAAARYADLDNVQVIDLSDGSTSRGQG